MPSAPAATDTDPAADRRTPSLFDRLTGLGRRARLALALIAGAAMTAGHPPVGVPWLLFLAVPLLMALAATAPSGRAAAWTGWFAGFGYFTTGMHWLGHAFLVDADKFAWLMPLGVVGLPAGLAIFWALAFWAGHRLWSNPVAGALGMAAIWTAVEFARGNILTGLPWNLPGYVWVDLPPMQAGAWVGPYGVTLATLVLSALPGLGLACRRPAVTGIAIALGIGVWIAGSARVPETIAFADDAPVIRAVQPNVPQAEKWDPAHYPGHYRRTLEATAAAPDPELGRPDIVVWPEAAIFLTPDSRAAYAEDIARAAGGAAVLIGALDRDAGGTANALLTLLPDGTFGPRYVKHHLVPFGEYLPFGELFDILGLRQFTIAGDLVRGPGPATLAAEGVPPFSPLICYEAIFPNKVTADDRPEWMVQPTNDAWFGAFAGPRQHFAQARIRAIEQGLPMVRAANTGISAIIDPYGRTLASLALHTFGHVDARLPQALPPTIYSRTGDWPALITVVFLALFSLFLRWISPRH